MQASKQSGPLPAPPQMFVDICLPPSSADAATTLAGWGVGAVCVETVVTSAAGAAAAAAAR